MNTHEVQKSPNNDASSLKEQEVLSEILAFLPCQTPKAWLESASKHIDVILIDHAHCEKKAASSALHMIYRYPERIDLINKMSRLAREELLHFEQVLAIIGQRDIAFTHYSPSRYADGMREHARAHEPARLIDLLIIGAYIEARSCERFHALVPYVDRQLGSYYKTLLRAEGRHFKNYLSLARQYQHEDKALSRGESLQQRIDYFAQVEKLLITTTDTEFRFHSGVPITE